MESELLSEQELYRYSRQLLLEDFGIPGQESLKNSRVLIAGLGGLGSIVAMYLTGACVGCLVLADDDNVDLTNLHRQILYRESDIGQNKARSARDNLSLLNSEVKHVVIKQHLDSENLPSLLENVDLAVDATDDYVSRFNLNRACLNRSIPLVSAAAVRFEGQIAIIHPTSGGPCYRCLYTDANQSVALSCNESGVLPPVLGVLGSLQAFEVIRCLCNLGKQSVDSLLFVDLVNLDFRRIRYTAKNDCPDCSFLRN